MCASSFRSNVFLCCLAVVFLSCFSASALAQDSSTAEKEIVAAGEALQKAAVMGPTTVQLGDQASIQLPGNFAFVPNPAASRFVRALGNTVDKNFIGLILGEEISGFVTVRFVPEGYIKDDDAKNWDVDALLDSLKEGTRQSNKEREKRGIPAVEVVGWVEKPGYNASTHQLVWSAAARTVGASDSDTQGVNYNTYLLGRKGYLSLNLVSDDNNVEREKPLAKTLLTAVSFNAGSRYEDFDSATDKVSEYGLAALIGGGLIAKKLGLFAVIGVFLLKAWKLILIGLIAVAAILKRFVKRKAA